MFEHWDSGLTSSASTRRSSAGLGADTCTSGTKIFANKAALVSAGWSVTAFTGVDNLAGAKQCKRGYFHAFRWGNGVGVAAKILSGSGSAELEYGNCWDAGKVNVYLNGVKIDGAPPLTPLPVPRTAPG